MSQIIAEGRRTPAAERMLAVSLEPRDRSALHARIAARFEEMLELGLVSEVRRLRERYALTPTMPSMRCVGYRQVWDHLDGAYGLATLRDKGVAATRQLAKRQLTWLRATADVARFDCLSDALEEQVCAHIAAQL